MLHQKDSEHGNDEDDEKQLHAREAGTAGMVNRVRSFHVNAFSLALCFPKADGIIAGAHHLARFILAPIATGQQDAEAKALKVTAGSLAGQVSGHP